MKSIKHIICQLALLFLMNEGNAQQVQELGTRLRAMRGSSEAVVRNEADHLNSLVYNSNPALYVQDGQLIRTGEQAPVRLTSDASSLSLLGISDSLYNNVEIICIKVENAGELNSILKLSDLTGFPKLKYIFFQCSFQLCPDQPGNSACEITKVSGMIPGSFTTGLDVVYTANIDN